MGGGIGKVRCFYYGGSADGATGIYDLAGERSEAAVDLSHMVGLPILRQAFLFGIVLYIWGMGLREQTQQDTANAMQKPCGYDVLIAMKRELEGNYRSPGIKIK